MNNRASESFLQYVNESLTDEMEDLLAARLVSGADYYKYLISTSTDPYQWFWSRVALVKEISEFDPLEVSEDSPWKVAISAENIVTVLEIAELGKNSAFWHIRNYCEENGYSFYSYAYIGELGINVIHARSRQIFYIEPSTFQERACTMGFSKRSLRTSSCLKKFNTITCEKSDSRQAKKSSGGLTIRQFTQEPLGL